jgi:hypothetical protein
MSGPSQSLGVGGPTLLVLKDGAIRCRLCNYKIGNDDSKMSEQDWERFMRKLRRHHETEHRRKS